MVSDRGLVTRYRQITTRYKLLVAIPVVLVAAVLVRLLISAAPATVSSGSADYRDAPQVTLLDVSKLRQDDGLVFADGLVESLQQADLRSQAIGPIATIGTAVGATVRSGDVIIALGNADISAQLGQAQAALAAATANLDGLKRGARAEELQIAETQVFSAQANVDSAQNDYANAQAKAASDLRGVYGNAVSAMQLALSALDNAMTQADNILGLDNTGANESFEAILSVNDSTKLSIANANFAATKSQLTRIRSQVSTLTTDSDPLLISDLLAGMEDALSSGSQLLLSVTDTLNATPLIAGMTQPALDAKKTIIETTRLQSLNPQYVALVNVQQAIATQPKVNATVLSAAKSRLDTARAALVVAKQQLAMQRAGATAEQLRMQEALVAQAKAYVAAVSAQLDKTIIRAPIDGEIAWLDVRLGELVSMGQLIATIVNTSGLQVKGFVSQLDFATITAGNPVVIGEAATGTVTRLSPSIDPQTKKVAVDVVVSDPKNSHLVVGQNVRMLIQTDGQAGAYRLPLQAVRIAPDGKAFVLTVNSQSLVEEQPVALGQLSGESVAVTAGLSDAMQIVALVYELKAGDRVQVMP